ncbi:YtpI family protein [Bacillus velezensis]|uniref:YtpI family protein n=1 Tax=Bacillus TaxID=1386 RepID=UPI0012E99598|nr:MULTISPECIES: YtpI family protein [Bacillus]KAF6601876.1 YtpI family protein [Bacillus sp. EKM420B]KAF6606279.1 YtpI family protein [Bacillus sp. EKM417B]MEC3660164.1 YtpI family protein [Bacillus velezensis]MEC3687268.1 YtpI family protein [Bacillus velezensis]MEC3789353.1 YtpI family protein [Bacillus velezensis]
MLVFVFLIGLSACFYVYYKVKGIQTKRALEKECFSAKSSMALGALVLLYGVNQMILFHSVLTLIIGGVFILIGAGSAWAGYKAYKHYEPIHAKEAERDHA